MIEPQTDRQPLVLFRIEDQRCALFLSAVERVIRAVAVTPVADAPEDVIGLINFHGTVVPILDLRGILGIPRRDIALADQFVIARAGARRVGILVEEVLEVARPAVGRTVSPGDILPRLGEFVEGAVKLEDGVILIYDPERFLRGNGSFLFDNAMKEIGT